MTTVPNQTVPSLVPTKCNNETHLDYSDVRKKKIDKITKYYKDLFDEYTNIFTEYSTDIQSQDADDRTYANITLRPKGIAYNNQIINLTKKLMSTINTDTELILDQKNELDLNSKNIEKLLAEIKILKNKKTDLLITEKSQINNLSSTKSGTEDINFTSQLYIGINILLVLIIIGLILYLVYSNFSKKINNNNNNNNINNIYKNII